MEERLGWTSIVIAVLLLLIFGFRFLPGGLYWSLTVLGFAIHFTLDQLFSADFFPTAPWIMWIFWGAVIGLAFAFWTIAPIYGIRSKQRRYILLSPLAPMLLLMAIRLLITR